MWISGVRWRARWSRSGINNLFDKDPPLALEDSVGKNNTISGPYDEVGRFFLQPPHCEVLRITIWLEDKAAGKPRGLVLLGDHLGKFVARNSMPPRGRSRTWSDSARTAGRLSRPCSRVKVETSALAPLKKSFSPFHQALAAGIDPKAHAGFRHPRQLRRRPGRGPEAAQIVDQAAALGVRPGTTPGPAQSPAPVPAAACGPPRPCG